MAQGAAGYNILSNQISFLDTASVDPFSRLRVSTPSYLFDAQLTHDLQPLLLEAVTAGSGATVTHDATNRMAVATFSSTPTGGKAYLQSYEWVRYQPGRGQLVLVTGNFNGGVANCLKFMGYGDRTNNGIFMELNGTTPQVSVYSNSSLGDQTVIQDNWNINKLNGTGPSGITMDFTKTQIVVIDFQALYVGRVRIGFDIGGTIIFAHEFLHANSVASPYIQNASLPVCSGMTCTGTVTTTMNMICCSVISEGGSLDKAGYSFSVEGTGTAGNGTQVHMLSVRPKTTFNSIENRTGFVLDSIDIAVTGNSPILWQLLIGQAISGSNTYTSVNTTYSAMEYNTAGTLSGSPAAIIAQGYVFSSTGTKGVSNKTIVQRYPITLDAAGLVRQNGTLTFAAAGQGGTSATRVVFNWIEIR